jgi:hypothetical protein
LRKGMYFEDSIVKLDAVKGHPFKAQPSHVGALEIHTVNETDFKDCSKSLQQLI